MRFVKIGSPPVSRIFQHFVLLFVILMIVSCNSVSSASVEDQAEAQATTTASSLPPINLDIPPDPITLEVWLDLDFTRNNSLYDELADEFEAAYPQVEVQIFSFVRESIPLRVEFEVSNNVPPDVVQGHVYALAGQGLAEPLEEYWAAWQAEDMEAVSQFLPAALEEVTWQRERYGIPLDIYTVVLLYNREHFDQAQLPYPEGDYDLIALRQAAKVLTDPEGERYGLGLTTDPWYASAWILGAGGNLLMGDPESGYTVTLNAPINIDALSFLTELLEDGYALRPTSRPRDYEDTRRQFLEGKISMYFGEPQDIHLIQSKNPDFPLGVAQLPQTPAKEAAASVLGSSGLFIPRGARHPDVAFEFMKWMASDKYVIPMARRQGRFPAKVWLETSPDFTKNLSLLPFFNQLKAARPYRLDLSPVAEEAFTNAIKESFYDLATPGEALQKAQSVAQDAGLEPAP